MERYHEVMSGPEFEAALADGPSGFPLVPPEPKLIDDDYAQLLRLSRAELVALATAPGAIPQVGAVYLPGSFEVEPPTMSEPPAEPIIETFVVDGDASCTPTGTNEALNSQWMPTVTAMASAVVETLHTYDISVQWPAYLTASLTSIKQVTNTPHFDSDQFIPDAGVDLVAIAASHDGTRIATEQLTTTSLRPGLPVQLRPEDAERFHSGAMATQQTVANRIMMFPQFGQLHSGPHLQSQRPVATHQESAHSKPVDIVFPVRNLLVLRATTTPTA